MKIKFTNNSSLDIYNIYIHPANNDRLILEILDGSWDTIQDLLTEDNLKTIYLYNGSDLVNTYSGYTCISSLSIDREFYIDNVKHTMTRINLKQVDTQKLINDLQESITSMYKQYDNLESAQNNLTAQIQDINNEINPSIDFDKMTLDEVKKYYISKSKSLLQTYLANHPITSKCHNGIESSYTITYEKQLLLFNRFVSYKIEKSINEDAVLTWNETGKCSEEWTESDFIQLLLEIQYRVRPLVTYQQKFEEYIENCTDKTLIMDVDIDYDSVPYTIPDFSK